MTKNGTTNGTLIHPTDEEQKAKEEAWTALAEEIRTEASPESSPVILDIPMLTPEQAAIEAEKGKEVASPLDTEGNDTFWTIGASTYNDLIVSEGHATYYEVAHKVNPLIEAAFGGLLGLTKAVIERYIKESVSTYPSLASWAFIFLTVAGMVVRKMARTYTQTNHFKGCTWTEPFNDPFSFTIALELPDGDGGLGGLLGMESHTDVATV